MKNFIITLTGDPGSGKSTTYTELKKYFESEGYEVVKYSTGSIFRKHAQKWIEKNPGKDIADFNKYAESHPEIDYTIDNDVKKIGERLEKNYNPNKIFIIDSRMAWKFIPDSLKVRLTIDENISGKRVFEDSTRNIEDQYKTLEDAIKSTVIRKESERQRYLKLYNVDLENEENYDLVINTSNAKIDEIVKVIFECSHLKIKNKPFPKTWKNPKYFLPTQGRGDLNEHVLNNYINIIKENGYLSNLSSIYSINVDGYDYVEDGHHRFMAAIASGKTLIPYYCAAKDNEEYMENYTARQVATTNLTYINFVEGTLGFGYIDDNFYKKFPPEIQKELDAKQNEER